MSRAIVTLRGPESFSEVGRPSFKRDVPQPITDEAVIQWAETVWCLEVVRDEKVEPKKASLKPKAELKPKVESKEKSKADPVEKPKPKAKTRATKKSAKKSVKKSTKKRRKSE
jgi:hypothetical protein